MSTPAGTPHIAHVLYMDVVAYSKLPTDHQIEVRERLRQIVRSIPDFQRVLDSGSLILRDTGDGMALAFFGDLTAPISWARHIAGALLRGPGIPLRMGIHTGPVYVDTDLTEAQNLAGDGINMAQRVMDCGDAGHILVSRETAHNLSHISAWNSALHDLGEVEVKHGVRVHIYNVYAKGFGNSAIPVKVAEFRQGRGLAASPGKPGHGSSKALVVVLALMAAGGAGYMWMNRHSSLPSSPSSSSSQPRETASLPSPAGSSVDAPVGSPNAAPAVVSPVVTSVALKDGLPVRLSLVSEIPLDAPKGLTIRFRVVEDVRVGDDVVISKGAAATGEIVDITKKKLAVIGAKMTFELEKVEAIDGRKLPIRVTLVRNRDGSSKRPVDAGDKKSKDVAADIGTKYWGYIDGAATVSVKK